jgi:SAM-dependent methyltransferase
VLDLGCNVGFLTLEAAKTAKHCVGLEQHADLIAIANRVRSYLGVSNCTFIAGDAATYRNESPFDLVIAAAPHGAVLFESQGRRSTTGVEEAFPEKVSAVAAAGFAVEREGQVCDDRVNLLAFAVLRKQT